MYLLSKCTISKSVRNIINVPLPLIVSEINSFTLTATELGTYVEAYLWKHLLQRDSWYKKIGNKLSQFWHSDKFLLKLQSLIYRLDCYELSNISVKVGRQLSFTVAASYTSIKDGIKLLHDTAIGSNANIRIDTKFRNRKAYMARGSNTAATKVQLAKHTGRSEQPFLLKHSVQAAPLCTNQKLLAHIFDNNIGTLVVGDKDRGGRQYWLGEKMVFATMGVDLVFANDKGGKAHVPQGKSHVADFDRFIGWHLSTSGRYKIGKIVHLRKKSRLATASLHVGTDYNFSQLVILATRLANSLKHVCRIDTAGTDKSFIAIGNKKYYIGDTYESMIAAFSKIVDVKDELKTFKASNQAKLRSSARFKKFADASA